MKKFQSLGFWKNPKFILAIILFVFFLKGVFLAAINPIFFGQDEARHYSSVQYVSEPRPITWPLIQKEETEEGTIQKFNYSQEIKETAKAMNYDVANNNIYSTFLFVEDYDGKNEAEINNNDWHQYNEYYHPNTAGNSLYHRLASTIEKMFTDQSIFVRYYLIRIFSVFLGMLTVLLSYFIAKNIGFSPKHSLLLSAIIAFQPRFSIYTAAINYDALLILTFTLFALGGVLTLKQNLNWKNLSLLIVSVFLGILTKPTATILLVMLAILLSFFAYKKISMINKKIKWFSFLIYLFAIIFFIAFIKKYIPTTSYALFEHIFSSVGGYLSDSLTMGKFALSSRTYWGALSWVNNWFLDNTINFVWIIEFFSTIGIAFFFSLKKKLDFLPEKKYVVFLLIILAALQIGIRAADWLTHGETGAPGRYFMPNIASHMILVFVGLGALLRKKEYFEKSLLVGLILMMTFMLFIIFDAMVLRFYL